MNAGTCWEQEYNRPNGLSVEKAPKSDLKSKSTNYPDHGHHGDPPPPHKENPHGRAGNRTPDLVVSSQKLRPPDHEAGRIVHMKIHDGIKSCTSSILEIKFHSLKCVPCDSQTIHSEWGIKIKARVLLQAFSN